MLLPGSHLSLALWHVLIGSVNVGDKKGALVARTYSPSRSPIMWSSPKTGRSAWRSRCFSEGGATVGACGPYCRRSRGLARGAGVPNKLPRKPPACGRPCFPAVCDLLSATAAT